ncbi:MAG: M23 family metallopeptidase [Nitrospirae bacterium]|nr:M23 family metallopeptidase [Nitrospirota bacterium]
MKQFLQKIFFPGVWLKTLAAGLLVIVVIVLVGGEIHRRVILSRVVTQGQVEAGWNAAGITLAEHRIQPKENFWKVAKEYGVDIDTIVGANPGLEKLHAALGQTIRVPNRKGVVHLTAGQETVNTISALYTVAPETIAAVNNLGPKHILVPGLELFVPEVKPVYLSEEMRRHFSLRGMFSSPLPGRITSGMGTRTHPVGGFLGKHTGVDLAAGEGTRIAASAAGTVLQTGEGEYIGKFVILSHKDSYTTLYGHCSQILAATGKTVKKGQIIAMAGQTGRTTGPHLHFEIRKNGIPQDPLKYLW